MNWGILVPNTVFPLCVPAHPVLDTCRVIAAALIMHWLRESYATVQKPFWCHKNIDLCFIYFLFIYSLLFTAKFATTHPWSTFNLVFAFACCTQEDADRSSHQYVEGFKFHKFLFAKESLLLVLNHSHGACCNQELPYNIQYMSDFMDRATSRHLAQQLSCAHVFL